MKWVIVGLVLMLLVAACGSDEESVVPESDLGTVPGGVTYFVDEEHTVECWLYRVGYRGGLSCLRMEEK